MTRKFYQRFAKMKLKKTYVDKATSPIKIQVPNTTTTTASPAFVPFSPAFITTIVPFSPAFISTLVPCSPSFFNAIVTSPASSVTTTTVGSDSRISPFWPFYNTVGTSSCASAISSSLFAPITTTVGTASLLSSPPPFIPPPPSPTQSSGTNDDDFIAIVDQVFSQPVQPVVELKRKRKKVVVNTGKDNKKKKRKQYPPQLMEYAVDLCLQNKLTPAQANTYYSLPARTVASKFKAAREKGIINKAPSSSVSGYMPDDPKINILTSQYLKQLDTA
ncbi:uncharacterized protein isoform X1 [Musca autumnalis]|uniref:uncharacterized protein isoform X1 n=1 Tax=Musca autumnalis TaxID=221902 RepID=UPI003CEB5486